MNYIGIFLAVIMFAFNSMADEKIPVINWGSLYEEEQEDFLFILEELITTNELIYGPGKKHSHGFVCIEIAIPDYIDESRLVDFIGALDATLKDKKNNFRTIKGAPLILVVQERKKSLPKPINKMEFHHKRPKVDPLLRKEQVRRAIAAQS